MKTFKLGKYLFTLKTAMFDSGWCNWEGSSRKEYLFSITRVTKYDRTSGNLVVLNSIEVIIGKRNIVITKI